MSFGGVSWKRELESGYIGEERRGQGDMAGGAGGGALRTVLLLPLLGKDLKF